MVTEPERDLSDGYSSEGFARLEDVHSLCQDVIADVPALTFLKGFKLDFSGNQDFHKVFFSVRCHCGTAALLSIEVAKSKTLSQVRVALPGLVEHLNTKAQQFSNMSCETHQLMRTGGRTQGQT